MKEYRLLVDYDVVDFMAALKKPAREALRKRFLEIRDWPTRYVDYQDKDGQGRPVSVNICGKICDSLLAGFCRPA